MMEEQETALAEPLTNVLEAIQPFQPDDSHKGTFLILRIAGLEQGMVLRLVKRKYRSWQNWRATDDDFKRIDDMVPVLAQKFGGEARVLRTALLDVSIVEVGISIFRRIITQQPVSDGMWTYATKMAGLRVPMMGAQHETGSPWEVLANSIRTTMAQKETILVEEPNGTKISTVRETVIQPSTEQKQMVNNIVQQMLEKAGEG